MEEEEGEGEGEERHCAGGSTLGIFCAFRLEGLNLYTFRNFLGGVTVGSA